MIRTLLRVLPPSLASALPIRDRERTGFGYIGVVKDTLQIAYKNSGKIKTRTIPLADIHSEEQIKNEIKQLLGDHKMVAAAFDEHELIKHLAPSLWLEEDIVSVKYKSEDGNRMDVTEHLTFVSEKFNKSNIAHVKILPGNEVEITDLMSLRDYQHVTSMDEIADLRDEIKKFGNQSISFINATPQGGGVALMRHALIRLFRLLEVNARWYILTPNQEVFNITKRKFHNVLQNVAPPGTELTEAEKKLYFDWSTENASLLRTVFETSDIIVIDDPQPAGLIPHIKIVNPKAKIIYRSHIQIEAELADKKGTPQERTWQFLWQFIKEADLFVSHPLMQFVPMDVSKDKLVFMPATTDPLDGLNKPLPGHQMDYYMDLFNRFLKEAGQTPLDTKRPYLIQVARFDPSKGIPHLLESYDKLSELMKEHNTLFPELVITGNGSVDDPDLGPIFEETMSIINSDKYKHIKKHIKVVALPHIDQLLNTLLRRSKVVLQLSTKEGFEIKVTEALMKGKPTIVYKAGGMPLQVKDNVNGFVVPVGQTDEVARHLFDLLTDPIYYQTMSIAASEYYDHSLLTIPNATRWLSVANRLLGTPKK